ncbi:Rpn family recombination-promoting nuclease/putative transposase [Fischerella thermalis]|uniref:Rpn family recombination-promoting nuclease/putative transposase n=1 Tax=Fischerella thermalis TaxID=372787 RepID=UPI0019DEAB5B|nr:Rpn family recombination-promoting nuclease/putative transposase [Fischerella thermalis]MBF1989079.1 Rpn family recombination-promoting nuclease/putative transposase [Fischerella thermalis M58_A2018_009]MBF2069653.1 Rpn family recombination-promoting nuclease/putative transposase [Fischerella thermalis M48_A2018_028]
MFDNLCKFLAETFSSDFASWLLGEPVTLTELSPSELSLEPIRADALILLQSDQVVLHLEFQTQPKTEIPFRMADYRLRVYRRFPKKRMNQVVIYLQKTTSDLVQQNTFTLERTHHEFDIIRLWEQPTSVFLQYPGLLPFAVLSETNDRTETLRQVAQIIYNIKDQRTQSNIAASTFILAGLVLNKDTIQQLLRKELMQESVTYQALIDEGRAIGRAEGRAEGIQEGIRRVAVNLLKEGMSREMVSKLTGLSVEQLQQLEISETDESQE